MRRLKNRWLVIIPVALSTVFVFVLFVPVVGPTAHFTICSPSGCENVVQYESISYHYGGWGALFQTGGWYAVQGWLCMEPCVAPLAGIMWPALELLLAADIISAIVIARPPFRPPN